MGMYNQGGTVIYSSSAVGSENGSTYQITPSNVDEVTGDKFECTFWASQTITGSSTPLMNLTVQFSPDNTNWYDGADFTQLTSSLLTKNEPKTPSIQAKYVRLKRTASGTIATYAGSVKITANGKFAVSLVT